MKILVLALMALNLVCGIGCFAAFFFAGRDASFLATGTINIVGLIWLIVVFAPFGSNPIGKD
jgi:hypothetical protein